MFQLLFQDVIVSLPRLDENVSLPRSNVIVLLTFFMSLLAYSIVIVSLFLFTFHC
jgi:hypothetical protein